MVKATLFDGCAGSGAHVSVPEVWSGERGLKTRYLSYTEQQPICILPVRKRAHKFSCL